MQYTHIGRAIGLSVIVVILLLFSRATFSFPVLTAHNYFASERVTWREMVIAWYEGLIELTCMPHDAPLPESLPALSSAHGSPHRSAWLTFGAHNKQ